MSQKVFFRGGGANFLTHTVEPSNQLIHSEITLTPKRRNKRMICRWTNMGATRGYKVGPRSSAMPRVWTINALSSSITSSGTLLILHSAYASPLNVAACTYTATTVATTITIIIITLTTVIGSYISLHHSLQTRPWCHAHSPTPMSAAPLFLIISTFFIALHGMQTLSSDENSVRLSVRPSHAWIVTKR